MSDSVTLRKTYGIVQVILSFIFLAIALVILWKMFHSTVAILISIPFIFFLGCFIISCMSFYENFLEAGKYMEKAERMKRQRIASKEEEEKEENENEEDEETEEIRDYAALQDSATLRNTYGFICFTISYILFAGVCLLDLYLFTKDPFSAILLFPECIIFVVIYLCISSACEYFMKAGMYIEKSKRIMEQ